MKLVGLFSRGSRERADLLRLEKLASAARLAPALMLPVEGDVLRDAAEHYGAALFAAGAVARLPEREYLWRELAGFLGQRLAPGHPPSTHHWDSDSP